MIGLVDVTKIQNSALFAGILRLEREAEQTTEAGSPWASSLAG